MAILSIYDNKYSTIFVRDDLFKSYIIFYKRGVKKFQVIEYQLNKSIGITNELYVHI